MSSTQNYDTRNHEYLKKKNPRHIAPVLSTWILTVFTNLNSQSRNSERLLLGSQGIHSQFVMDPWIHICNGYFKIFLSFLKKVRVVKNYRGTSLIGDVFIWYER